MAKAQSAEELKLSANYLSLKNTLLQEQYADRLEKSLAHWALPSDRRLPLAFLGRTLRDLLSHSFEELAATPGVGQKKIHSLIKLLIRATKQQPSEIGALGGDRKATLDPSMVRCNTRSFEPGQVSEATWEQWRASVLRHDMGNQLLGRLCPTLQALPTVIWKTPLSYYSGLTLEEIRSLKTHGEKRVRVVLEVFCGVHEVLTGTRPQHHLALRLTPSFVPPIEQWVVQAMAAEAPLTQDEVRAGLVAPLLEQVYNDAGQTLARLAEGRLGLGGATTSVRQQSRRLGVTRARIYQLLEQCGEIADVRWPEGRAQLMGLHAKQANLPGEGLMLLRGAIELFYPGTLNPADVPAEPLEVE